MATHLTYGLIKDVVEVCATVTDDENPFLIDGRFKSSVGEGANSKATKATRLSSLVDTLIIQESLASVPVATLEKAATTILDVIPKSICHKSDLDIRSYDFSKVLKPRSEILGRSAEALNEKSEEAKQFNSRIATCMLSICKARTEAVKRENKKRTANDRDKASVLVIDAEIIGQATGQDPEGVDEYADSPSSGKNYLHSLIFVILPIW
jgi:hypothetical protein